MKLDQPTQSLLAIHTRLLLDETMPSSTLLIEKERCEKIQPKPLIGLLKTSEGIRMSWVGLWNRFLPVSFSQSCGLAIAAFACLALYFYQDDRESGLRIKGQTAINLFIQPAGASRSEIWHGSPMEAGTRLGFTILSPHDAKLWVAISSAGEQLMTDPEVFTEPYDLKAGREFELPFSFTLDEFAVSEVLHLVWCETGKDWIDVSSDMIADYMLSDREPEGRTCKQRRYRLR